MLIREKNLQHWINHFYGYGSWHAKIWFVAYEEGGGDVPEEVAEKIDYFWAAHPPGREPVLCDVRELYRHVTARLTGPNAKRYATRYDYRFGDEAIQHGVWKNLIAFAHGYRDKPLPDLLQFQRGSFLPSSNSEEALIQLYPLPSPHNHAWYYSWLDLPQFPFLKSRQSYERHLFPTRSHALFQKMKTHKPEIVVMYAMNNINTLKETVREYFPAANFTMIKATRLKIPQHHRAELDGTKLLITTQIPALRHNRAETGFEWYEFGKIAKGDSR